MKARLMLAWVSVWLAAMSAAWGGTAQVQLMNNSIEMFSSSCSCGFGLVWKLHFSSSYTEDPLQANGELASRPAGSATTHWAYMLLEDPSMYSSATLVEIDLPVKVDLDANGVPDFFEMGRETAAASSGTYQSDLGGGTFTFSWTRSAGSAQGTCVIYMNDRMLGTMGPFNGQYAIVSHKGSLEYTRTADGGSGAVDLQKSGNASWRGSVQYVRASADRLNTLTVQAGAWTNGTDSFFFEETTLTRGLSHSTVYQGILRSSSAAFGGWTLRIVDSNDSDRNGIPDLSDDLVVQPPRRPSLELRKTGARLELLVSGDTGRTHEVQAATSLNATTWELVTSLVLTNDPQVVEVSAPSSGSKFWRVEAK